MKIPFTSIVLTASALVSSNPVEVRTLAICASSAGQTVQLYDGKDANSGVLRAELKVGTTATQPLYFPPGYTFERGLYASLDANVTHATIVYRVLPHVAQLELAA